MYFANFNKLKIDTDYNYKTVNIPLNIDLDMSLSQVKAVVEKEIEKIEIKPTSLPVLYDYSVAATGLDEIEFADLLITLANIIVPVTLQHLETGEVYERIHVGDGKKPGKREYRLDVPQKLKALHASNTVLKRACNRELITPVLNITIGDGTTNYYLCMGRDIEEDLVGDSSDE